MGKNRKDSLIAQSRPLVEAKYNFTLWEFRLFVEVLEQINKDDEELKKYRLYYKDLVKQYTGGKKAYGEIRQAANNLFKKIVKFNYKSEEVIADGSIKELDMVFSAPIFVAAHTPKNWREMATEMFIDLEINNRLKDQLIQLKKNYLLYDKRNILKLRSKFAVRIYQLLKSNERRDSENVISIFTVKDLREMLLVDDDGVPTNQYKKYFLFKKKVLFIAQEQINEHTDISFTFEEIKKGRRIDSIKFFVRKNRKASKQKDSVKSELINSESLEEWVIPESEQSPVYQKLIGVGITSDGANLLIGLYGNDELLLSELKFAQKKLESSINVKNPAGFIYKSIERQEFQKSELIRKQAEQKAKTKKQSEAELIKTHTAKIKELRAEYTVKRNEALETVVNDYTKAKRKKEIDKRLEGQLFLRKAYKKAVEKKNKADEIDLTCSLFGPELEVSNLDTFENYILHEYSYVLRDQGRHKIIMKSK